MYTITNSVKCQNMSLNHPSVDISWKKQMQNVLYRIGDDGLSHSICYHIAPHCLCHPPMDTRKHIYFAKIPLQPSHNNSQLINEISVRCSCQHLFIYSLTLSHHMYLHKYNTHISTATFLPSHPSTHPKSCHTRRVPYAFNTVLS